MPIPPSPSVTERRLDWSAVGLLVLGVLLLAPGVQTVLVAVVGAVT